MTREIPVLPPVDSFPFLPTQDRLILDIKSLLGIMRQFIRTMFAEVQTVFVVYDSPVPLEAFFLPVVKPLLHLTGMDEELQVPLLELTLAEQEVTRRDLVAERFPDLADTEGNLHA